MLNEKELQVKILNLSCRVGFGFSDLIKIIILELKKKNKYINKDIHLY